MLCVQNYMIFLEIEHRNDNKLLLYNVIIGERKKKFDGKGSL